MMQYNILLFFLFFIYTIHFLRVYEFRMIIRIHISIKNNKFQLQPCKNIKNKLYYLILNYIE